MIFTLKIITVIGGRKVIEKIIQEVSCSSVVAVFSKISSRIGGIINKICGKRFSKSKWFSKSQMADHSVDLWYILLEHIYLLKIQNMKLYSLDIINYKILSREKNL